MYKKINAIDTELTFTKFEYVCLSKFMEQNPCGISFDRMCKDMKFDSFAQFMQTVERRSKVLLEEALAGLLTIVDSDFTAFRSADDQYWCTTRFDLGLHYTIDLLLFIICCAEGDPDYKKWVTGRVAPKPTADGFELEHAGLELEWGERKFIGPTFVVKGLEAYPDYYSRSVNPDFIVPGAFNMVDTGTHVSFYHAQTKDSRTLLPHYRIGRKLNETNIGSTSIMMSTCLLAPYKWALGHGPSDISAALVLPPDVLDSVYLDQVQVAQTKKLLTLILSGRLRFGSGVPMDAVGRVDAKQLRYNKDKYCLTDYIKSYCVFRSSRDTTIMDYME